MGRSRENFVRLAEARTSRVLRDIELLSNLANRSNYSYSETDIRAIFQSVKRAVSEAELRFKTNLEAKASREFRLPQ